MLLVSLIPAWARAQTEFHGKLDPGLHVGPAVLGFAFFDPISNENAKLLGVAVAPGDKVLSGEFTLPKGGSVHYKYKAAIVRSPDGSDVLYVDANRNGRFDPDERIPFHLLTKEEDPKGKDFASFEVVIPDGPFHTCPMEVRID